MGNNCLRWANSVSGPQSSYSLGVTGTGLLVSQQLGHGHVSRNSSRRCPERRSGVPWPWEGWSSWHTSARSWAATFLAVVMRWASSCCAVASAVKLWSTKFIVVHGQRRWTVVEKLTGWRSRGPTRCKAMLYARHSVWSVVLRCSTGTVANCTRGACWHVHSFNGREASFGCGQTPFEWFPVAPGSRPS